MIENSISLEWHSNADQYSRHIHTSCISFDEAQIWLACGSYVQFPHVRMFHIGISPKYIVLFILPYLISFRCCWIFSLANNIMIIFKFLGQKIKNNTAHCFIFYSKLYLELCKLFIELNSCTITFSSMVEIDDMNVILVNFVFCFATCHQSSASQFMQLFINL